MGGGGGTGGGGGVVIDRRQFVETFVGNEEKFVVKFLELVGGRHYYCSYYCYYHRYYHCYKLFLSFTFTFFFFFRTPREFQ